VSRGDEFCDCMARHKPYRPPTSMTLAGIPVRRELVEWAKSERSSRPPSGDGDIGLTRRVGGEQDALATNVMGVSACRGRLCSPP